MGTIITLTGVSGCGKTTLLKSAIAEINELKRLPAVTTRPPRNNEIDGQDKFFVNSEEFDNQVREGLLCIIDTFYNHKYAFRKQDVSVNHPLICEVYHRNLPDIKLLFKTISIYIKPPELTCAANAVLHRQTEFTEVDQRIEMLNQDQKSIEELYKRGEFDYLFINNYDAESKLRFNRLISTIVEDNYI